MFRLLVNDNADVFCSFPVVKEHQSNTTIVNFRTMATVVSPLIEVILSFNPRSKRAVNEVLNTTTAVLNITSHL